MVASGCFLVLRGGFWGLGVLFGCQARAVRESRCGVRFLSFLLSGCLLLSGAFRCFGSFSGVFRGSFGVFGCFSVLLGFFSAFGCLPVLFGCFRVLWGFLDIPGGPLWLSDEPSMFT